MSLANKILTNKRSFALNIQKVGLLFSFLYYDDLILEYKFLKREYSLPVSASMK